MADDILKNIPLPADLPENWTSGQTVAPTGAEVGMDEQHGYNYLMKQVNNAQKAATALNEGKLGLHDAADNGVAASGSNYVRFGDGTQICWGSGTMPVKEVAGGNSFLRYSGILTVNFPVAFSSKPVGIVNGGDHAAYWNSNSPWTTTTSIRVSIAANGTADSMQYSYVAIGRWK